MNWRLIAVLAVAALAVSGCNTGEGILEGKITTRVRVVNALSDSGAIDLALETGTVATGVGFQATTSYQNVTPGAHTFTVTTTGGNSTLVSASNTLTASVDYTYVVFGSVTAASAVLFADAFTTPNGGTFKLRIVNAANGPGALDVYLTPAGTDISATAPAIANTGYGSATAFVEVPAGTAEIRITPTGSKDVIYDTGVRNFPDKSATDLVIFNNGSTQLVNAAVLTLDPIGPGTGEVANSVLSEFRLVNASNVTSPVNVFLDGRLLLANVPATGVADYQRVSVGSHAVTIEAASNPGATLLSTTVTLAPASDSSIVLTGSAGALQALALTDNNLPPDAGFARVRFVNAASGTPALDAYVNFARQLSSLAPNAASPYVAFPADSAGTPFEVDFNIAGTGTSVLMLPNTILSAGKIYTVYVVGSPGALRGVIAADR